MVLAHSIGSTTNAELLLIGAAAVVLGVIFMIQKSAKPVVNILLIVVGLSLGAGAFAFSSGGKKSDAVVTIVSPANGAMVPAGEPFKVEVELAGGQLAGMQMEMENGQMDHTMPPPTADGGHLHVFVDEELVSMPGGTAPEISLTAGTHRIEVEYVDSDHSSFSPPILDEIEVTAR